MSRPLRILLVLIALAALGVFAWRWAAIDADPPVQQTPGAAVADAAPQSDDPAAQRIAADLRRLADDDMAGRETGTSGFERAAAFVAARMADAGLEPAGDDGTWFQRVPLLTGTPLREGARLAVERDGMVEELRFGDEFLPWSNFNATTHAVRAPAAFVGHAIHAPELGHDDFAGVDLRGRIAVLLPGAPDSFDDNARAYHSATREKFSALAERGAVGAVIVSSPQFEARMPWPRMQAAWDKPAMRLRDADGVAVDGFPQLQAVAAVGVAAADLLLFAPGRTAAQVFDRARDGTGQAFALDGHVVIEGGTRIEAIESHNVIGRLPGSDPELAGEHVVHTAHLDHVGVIAMRDGDAIHSGALDNALGVSIMLETARTLVAADAAPRRPQLFAALTGEEQGLLGAQHFVARPTVAREGLVANINIDMPVLLAPSTDAVVIGAEHSTLQAVAEAAAEEIGVKLSPDPFPEEVTFVRSDQYAFVRAGIPALYLDGGVESADGERDPLVALTYFLRNCYHQPCDDASQPVQYDDAARLARLAAAIATRIGNDNQRPRWNPGDFFGDRFAR